MEISEERLIKYLRAVRAKRNEIRATGLRVTNKIAKLRGAEEVLLAVLDNDRLENLWENLKLWKNC